MFLLRSVQNRRPWDILPPAGRKTCLQVAFLTGLPVESAFALLLTRVTELIMCLSAQNITDK